MSQERMTEPERDHGAMWLNDHYCGIWPDDIPTVEWILEMAEAAVFR